MITKLVTAGLMLVMFALAGCSIEESDRGLSGSVHVSMTDSSGAPVERAVIWVDGRETSQRTPAVVSGLTLGTHVISAIRPDVYEAFDTVAIAYNDTSFATLATSFRPVGPVELVDAPDSTVLLLNNLPSGVTPPTVLYVGIGSQQLSLFLPGYATDLPAKWTITVVQNDTARLTPTFTSVTTGSAVDQLAPLFALGDDRDSSIFRLQDYRGQVILLTFFFADCAPCAAEMPYIQEVYQDPAYAGKIEFFGIDPQDPYFTFIQFRLIQHPELGLTFPLLYAFQQGVKEAYNVTPFPSNIFIDQTGRIRYHEASVDEALIRDHIETLLNQAGG